MRRSLILDEPTASLDARAEFEVYQRFVELTAGKMAILISHRFSTVRMADRILVLEDGRIAEQGSHQQLVALGGRYAELFEFRPPVTAKGWHHRNTWDRVSRHVVSSQQR